MAEGYGQTHERKVLLVAEFVKRLHVHSWSSYAVTGKGRGQVHCYSTLPWLSVSRRHDEQSLGKSSILSTASQSQSYLVVPFTEISLQMQF